MFKRFTIYSFVTKIFFRLTLVIVVIVLYPLHTRSQQASDCFNGIPVCSNTYVQPIPGSGFGGVMEIGTGNTCLTNGETNSTWYIFRIQSAGSLLFQIDPMNTQDDYDYIVYNLTGNNCSDVVNGVIQPVRCNYSSAPGTTGLTQGVTNNFSNAAGANQCAPLAALQDETYARMVNNFTATNSGYTLNFSGSAVIYDTQAPVFTGVQASDCSPKKVVLNFSEDVLCASVASDGSDFEVTGPSGVTVSSAIVAGCNAGVTGTTVKLIFTSTIQTTGTYHVRIRNGSDGNTVGDFCNNMIPAGASLDFTVNHIGPDVSIVSVTDQTCSALGAATAAITGGTPPFTYHWDTNPVQTSLTAHNLSAGSYEFEVTDAGGCVTNTTAHISLAGMPELTFTKFSVRCDSAFSGAATVNVQGGTAPYQYEWNTQPPQFTQTASGLETGSYIVTVTTADGCIVHDTVTIPVIGLPELNLFQTNVSCDGLTLGTASVTATGSAPFTYEWSTSPPQYTTQISGLVQGTYTVTVTDSVGCISTAHVNIGQGGMTVADSVTNLDCATIHNGTATVTAANGLAPYNYEWNTDPVQHGATAMNLAGGTYSVTVTDAGGCVETHSVTVSAPAPIVISITTVDAGCGQSNGSATLNVAGGYGPYSFAWTGMAQTDSFITGMPA